MAIDPTISLKAGGDPVVFDPLGSMSKAYTLKKLMTDVQYQPQLLQQRLATERASQLGTEASTAGTVIANEKSRRENAARVRIAEIAKANSRVDPKTGKITVDHAAIANQAASEGMEPETVLQYLDKAATTGSNVTKSTKDRRDEIQKGLVTLNELLRVQTDPARADTLAKAGLTTLGKAYGDDEVKEMAGVYWNLSGADPTTMGQTLIKQANTNANAQISPQQTLLNRSQGISPEQWGDNNSPLTQAHQDILIGNGLDPAKVKGLTYGQIRNDPTLRSLLENSVVPAAERGDYRRTAEGMKTNRPLYDELEAMGSKLQNEYGDIPLVTAIERALSKKLISDADRDRLTYMLQVARKDGMPLDDNVTPKSLVAIIRGARGVKGGQEDIQRKAGERGVNVPLPNQPSQTTQPATFNLTDTSPENLKKIRAQLVPGVGGVTQADVDAFDIKYGTGSGEAKSTTERLTQDEAIAKIKKGILRAGDSFVTTGNKVITITEAHVKKAKESK